MHTNSEIERAIATFARLSNGGLVVTRIAEAADTGAEDTGTGSGAGTGSGEIKIHKKEH